MRLCVLRLPRERQPRPQRRPRAPQLLQEALCTAPVYCACHAKGSRGPSGDHARRSSSRSPVYCACHAKGCRGPSGDHARRSSSRRLCVLRLPRERQPRPQRRPRAPQLLQEALCTAPATRKAAMKLQEFVLRLPEGVREALSTAPATRKAARKLSVLHLPE